MATLVGTQKELGSLLNQLIELDYDAIEAYEAAVERISDAGHKAQLAQFMEDHRRHIVDLTTLAQEAGITPATKADVKAVLTRGKVVLGSLMGDKAILLAMKTNEEDTNTAYDRVVSRTDIPSYMRTVFEKNLADERRHRAYIVQALGGHTEATTSR